jgi:hypothetical protein
MGSGRTPAEEDMTALDWVVSVIINVIAFNIHFFKDIDLMLEEQRFPTARVKP